MKIGLYQNRPVFGDVNRNVEQAVTTLSQVNADLIVLPELYNTGYQFISRQELEGLAEEIPSGKTCQAFMALARTQEVFFVFGLAERDGERLYNSAAVVGPDGFIGKYRKTHLFSEELSYFDPGGTGFRVFDLGLAKIGVMICFDWWFPESARALALLGAEIICHPANLVLPHCQAVMMTRSLENGVFTITANRVGTESRGGKHPLMFTGQSQIVDNQGKVMAKLGENETGVLLTDIDPGQARNKAITSQNDRFRDRRPQFYAPLMN
ncbi:MAG: nitrilase-related carbon-nitrogen hydrolase [Thermodesulfobacteriota bacterium]|nr:nitrilase-related carbon-nitrogen hydrolase [Thermodesulfobacteriota bacterium]